DQPSRLPSARRYHRAPPRRAESLRPSGALVGRREPPTRAASGHSQGPTRQGPRRDSRRQDGDRDLVRISRRHPPRDRHGARPYPHPGNPGTGRPSCVARQGAILARPHPSPRDGATHLQGQDNRQFSRSTQDHPNTQTPSRGRPSGIPDTRHGRQPPQQDDPRRLVPSDRRNLLR
ncbi:unnamed protein product, partial [Aphanomyces euteiches]